MKTAEVAPAIAHLQELRSRLLWCVGVLLVGAAVGYVFRKEIIAVLEHPLGKQLFYTSPTGSFEFVMKICFLAGFLVALPLVVYHLLRFIEPALSGRISRRFMAVIIGSSFSLMSAGVAFGYYVSLPATLHFFNQVGTDDIQAIITADQYFTFLIRYLAVFAAVFQLPLLLLFINRFTPLGPTQLKRYRKFVIAGSFILALFVAPDPVSQAVLAVPIILLYELSLVMLMAVNRYAAKRPSRADAIVAWPKPDPEPIPPAPGRPAPAVQRLTAPRTIDLRQQAKVARPSHTLDLRQARSLS